MVDLKLCPFCGGEAEIRQRKVHHKNWFGKDYRLMYRARCTKCGATVGHFSACLAYHDERTGKEWGAIPAWNTRAERTCRNLEKRNSNLWFVCSKCGANSGNGTYSEEWMHQDHTDEECAEYNGEPFNYCPNCGAKVIGG